MQKYQLTILINEKVSDTDQKAIFESVKKSFNNLLKEELWGVRSLAYDIKHNNKAFYAFFEFESEPQGVIALDKDLRLNEDIIRYLIVKSKKQKLKGKNTNQNSKVEETTDKIEDKEIKKVEVEVKTKEKAKK